MRLQVILYLAQVATSSGQQMRQEQILNYSPRVISSHTRSSRPLLSLLYHIFRSFMYIHASLYITFLLLFDLCWALHHFPPQERSTNLNCKANTFLSTCALSWRQFELFVVMLWWC